MSRVFILFCEYYYFLRIILLHMKFRKIPTIVLLCSVLLISVLFSMFLYREGFQEGLPEMKNPTPLEMKRIVDILDGGNSKFQKILEMLNIMLFDYSLELIISCELAESAAAAAAEASACAFFFSITC